MILRYGLTDGTLVERFIFVVKLQDHTGAHMEELVLNTPSALQISLSDMRGQYYDNTSNIVMKI